MTQPQPAIDLTRHHFVYHLGDVSLYGSWIFNDDQEAEEPALVLIPRYRARGFKPCVVALSAAYRYNNPRYMVQTAREFVLALGFEDTMAQGHRILTLLHDHLPDLLTIPPSPTTAIVVGEASFDIGGRRRTIEMLDFEPTPQA